MATIIQPLDAADEALARAAAEWLEAFYPAASARVDGGCVVLEGDELGEDQLARIWIAALLNERSYADNLAARRELMEQLTR